MTHAAHVPADFVSTFRQRFAPLFGRKIGRQRSEQYLGGLLGGRAERRNVTSLAGTVDGATARALGWLLNKSPWQTRPIVDALQTYVGDSFGAPEGLFTLNLDSFVKRGDNAVGVEKQYVHHLGRTQNCQIGVFLAYGTDANSSLVDASLYMPHSWTDNAPRREKAGVPASVEYQPKSALAVELLRNARAAGHLPGAWVTTWHGEGFEPDLRARLDADGWRYLLPISPKHQVFASADAAAPRPVAEILADAANGALTVRRVWEAAGGDDRRACWLLGCTDALTGGPVAFVSNSPEDDAPELFERILAARWETARMLAARCAGVSLDVYRVRGWDGWHRHVALALLASAFRACLPSAQVDAPEADAPIDDLLAFPEPVARHPADDGASEEAFVAAEETVYEDESAPAYEAESAPAEEAAPELIPFPLVAVPTTYRLVVDLLETDWRAVRAFQTWLEAELSARSTARESGLMPAFEGPAEVIGNAVTEASRALEQSHELVAAHAPNGHANGHATRNGALVVASLGGTIAPPSAPPAESAAWPAAPTPPAPAGESNGVAEQAAPKPKQVEEKARPAEEQMVVLDVGDESYGIPVQRVREIIRVPAITRVPNGPTFLEGVINLRGQVIPVLDLRKHFGIPAGDETRRSRVVVSELGRHTVGLIVDGVSEVVMVATTEIEPPPSLIAGANDGQICGVARLGDRLVLFLDPDRMLPNR